MAPDKNMILSLIRKPSALLPILRSLAAITLVVGHAALYGIVCEADEGTPAHLSQLLMGAHQVPILVVFATQ